MEKIKFCRFSEIDLDQYLDKIIEIDTSFFKELAWNKSAFHYELPEKVEKSFLVFNNEELIGYCVISKKNDFYHIHKIVVDNDFGNLGLGSKMIDFILNTLKITEIALKVDVNNIFAINFYFKHKFKIIDIQNGYYTMKLE